MIQWDPLIQMWQQEDAKFVCKKDETERLNMCKNTTNEPKQSPACHQIKNGVHSGK